MDTKMRDLGGPTVADPPPYSAEPTPGSSYGNAGTNQPQVTVVHPNTTYIQGAMVIPSVIVTNNMGPGPAPYVCPSCNQQIVTRVERVASMRTHLCAVLLCLTALWPCVCIPYCMDSCKKAEHYCPNCSAYIGTFSGKL